MKIIFLTIALSITVAYFQWMNWTQYWREHDGANTERLILFFINLSALLICIGCLIQSWGLIQWVVLILMVGLLRLYWSKIIVVLKPLKDKLYKILHRKHFP